MDIVLSGRLLKSHMVKIVIKENNNITSFHVVSTIAVSTEKEFPYYGKQYGPRSDLATHEFILHDQKAVNW